jgi:mannosyltransferase
MTTALFGSTTAAGARSGGQVASMPRRNALLVGLIGFAVSFAGSWIPSFWGDEAASVMSAQRSLDGLLSLLTKVDAVHGA